MANKDSAGKVSKNATKAKTSSKKTNVNSPKANKNKTNQRNIIVFGAHSDDFVLGAGGTIANYRKEKKNITCIVFSYGEMSHPWLKEKEVQKMREKEAQKASEVLGCKIIFFQLKEGNFMEGAMQQDIVKTILKIVKQKKPIKVFTHSSEDPHPDHKAVNTLTLQIYEELEDNLKPEVYVYSVWNPVEFKTKAPALIIDITETFKKKIEAFRKFKSQKVHTAYPIFIATYRAIKDGFRIRKRFAEKFFRIK
ncbi:MAG: PIG-L deacetylase family protein [Nanoarchaeota archaeon]|nr:PIG-L family deacetylase [Nanoarchaeota archaeon]